MSKDTVEEAPAWSGEAQTGPGTPQAKMESVRAPRLVSGPGVYSDIFEALGPLTVRTDRALTR